MTTQGKTMRGTKEHTVEIAATATQVANHPNPEAYLVALVNRAVQGKYGRLWTWDFADLAWASPEHDGTLLRYTVRVHPGTTL